VSVRWGLHSVWVGVVAIFVIAGASASAAPAPQVLAQGVVILPAGGDPVAMPAAQLPGDAAVAAPHWRSSKVAPVVRVARAWSVVQASQASSSARVVLRSVSLFGGEVRFRGLRLVVSQPAGGDAVIDQRVSGLVVDGTRVAAPAAGADPLPLGDWGELTAAATVDGGLAGLRLHLVADHDGLAAGSEIDLGLTAFAPSPPPPTVGGDGGGSDPGGAPTPVVHHHHHHHPVRHTHPQPPHPAHHHHHHHAVAVHHPAHLPQLGSGLRAGIVRAAAGQVGWPYVWGGESRAEGGFDCSGLVDYAYAAAGHPLPGRPTAAVLWQMGIPIDRAHLRPGDLAFLGAPSGEPYHVALYAGDGVVIVASGRHHPIAEVPLDSVPWDGFARIWAKGGVLPPSHSGLLTAPVKARPAAISTRPAAPAGLRRTGSSSSGAAASVLLKSPRHARPAPPRMPPRRTPEATAAADPRIRVAPPSRPVGLPSA
jgi:hypothetical protein